jgi:ABC-type antimicrobial peptide transport system permease subunit
MAKPLLLALINEFDIIAFRTGVIAFDALMMLAIAFVSALLPTAALKRIKPVAIIKAKE